MTALSLIGAAPVISKYFAPVPLTDQVQDIPSVILAVLLYCLGAAYLALWRAAPDYRVFRSLGIFSIVVGMVQSLAYFGGSVPSLSLRAAGTLLVVETAGEAMRVPNRRWTRFFWPFYLFAAIAAWFPSLSLFNDWPVYIASVPLGILIIQGFRQGHARDRMVGAAFAVYFLVRLTLSNGFQTLMGIPGSVTIAGWRWPIAFSTHFALVAATLAIFVRDLVRDRREKERMAAELAAGRAVQQVLILEKTPSIPGFDIQSVYKPFTEVGGDFFQVLPLMSDSDNGGVLLIIGDVSGKGLRALDRECNHGRFARLHLTETWRSPGIS